MSEKISPKQFLLVGLLLIAAFSRLIPHPPNFTALGAMALFGGAYIYNRFMVLLLPLGALWFSDIFLNNMVYSEFYDGFVLFPTGHVWVYASFILITLLARILLTSVNMRSVGLSGFSAALIFYLVSNFGVWTGGIMYPLTLDGLLTCYIAGLPFFGWTLLGNTFYCTVLFGCFELANKKIPVLQIR